MIKVTLFYSKGKLFQVESTGHAKKNNGFSQACFGLSFLLRTFLRVLLANEIDINYKIQSEGNFFLKINEFESLYLLGIVAFLEQGLLDLKEEFLEIDLEEINLD